MNKEWPLKKGLSSPVSVLKGNDSHLNWHQRCSKRLFNSTAAPCHCAPGVCQSQGHPATPARTLAAEGTEAALGTGVMDEAGLGCRCVGGPGQGCAKLEPGSAGVGADGPGELSWTLGQSGMVVTLGHWQQFLETNTLAEAMTFGNGSSTKKKKKAFRRNLN